MKKSPAQARPDREPKGRFVVRGDRRLYEIDNVDRMPAFLMTVVGDADLWMYLSSSGGVTAGRVEPERCLFPYETDDRLHAASGITGGVTVIRLPDGTVWRPLDTRPLAPGFTRRLLRTPVGDAVVFEERHDASGITFRAEWALSDAHGIVRMCEFELDDARDPVQIEVLDGLINLMPAGVPLATQQAASTLVDAYKRAEFDPASSLAVYTLEAAISDRPEARESLRANIVWRTGLRGAEVTLDPAAIEAFERDEQIATAPLLTGRRCAYLCRAQVRLTPGAREAWAIVGDAHLDHAEIDARSRWLRETPERMPSIVEDLAKGTERLGELLDRADGSQVSADESVCAAHRSNTLFNAMRGGVPVEGYAIDVRDFRSFLHSRHAQIAGRHDGHVAGMGASVSVETLLDAADRSGDAHLQRLALEYLPLTFGRRHGDPSRPWNRFRVRTRHADGSRALGYEGNWRDIFQNWEAMCRSYPSYLPGVIAKFVNASTPDGHNPYRISEAGIDWEEPDPDDPWSNIGYWGDHQLVYLLHLLEQLHATDPDTLGDMLERRVFSYADVPFQIRPFDALVHDPKSSIRFEHERNERIMARAAEVGADGRLVPDTNGEPVLVSLIEKLLVPVLAKVSNLVPGGGVWMNTQRPEWNDANNALAGYGLSMVTLYQLRRFADFCVTLLGDRESAETPVSGAIADWCDDVLGVLVRWLETADTRPDFNDELRWRMLEDLGRAASRARERVAERGLGPASAYPVRAITDLFRLTRHVCDHSIAGARRPDGLYDSYNVLHLGESGASASVERLHPMLEGQVAVLDAGVLDADAANDVLDALFTSDLYRPDQRTFILYPRVDRPAFSDRNIVPKDAIDASPLMSRILDDGERRIASRDASGRTRFNADLVSGAELEDRLRELGQTPGWVDLVADDAEGVRDAYERTFRHTRFTGRSSTMHKYEGLGSVYWHMVSKLLLAVQRCTHEASDRGEPQDSVHRLASAYRRIREGLGMRKSPSEFGAVPHEPYSHTPWHAGAQQPGMTGQVKEGFLARLGELGVRLWEGELKFAPLLLDPSEFLTEAREWRLRGSTEKTIDLPAGTLGFTLCGTPVVMIASDRAAIALELEDGASVELEGGTLPRQWTAEILGRTGRIAQLTLSVPAGDAVGLERPAAGTRA